MTQTHQPCPYTDCGSSDAFSWFGEAGHCHSCHRSYPSKGMPEVFNWVKETYPLRGIRKLKEVKSGTYESVRGIDTDVCKLYGIQVQKDEDNNPVRYAFKYPDNVKYRGYDEKKFWTKSGPIHDLFGPQVNAGTSKRLYLCEGEFDAASLYQVLGKTFPVLGLPTSGVGDKFFKKNRDYLDSFQEIIYAGELDDAGRKAADKFYEVFPSKLYYVPMSKHKDANEFLMAGDHEDLMWAARKPQRYSPENFFISLDDFDKILDEENPYEFTPTPCDALNEVIMGHTKGGMTLYKAYPGTGKTSLFRYFQYDLLKNTDQKIAVLHLEETKATTLRGLASYQLGKDVNTRKSAEESGVSEQEVREAIRGFIKNENLILWEYKGGDYSDVFERTLDYIRLAVTVYGANYIFLDHIQRLAYMAGVENATNSLTTFAVRVEDMCRELNFGFNAISHLNSDGAAKYAKSLEESCIIALDMTRDKDSEDEVEKNTIQLHIHGKNRPWAKLGEAGRLYYDPTSTLLEEV